MSVMVFVSIYDLCYMVLYMATSECIGMLTSSVPEAKHRGHNR